MDQQLKKNLSSSEYWFRAFYVAFFLLCAEIAGTLMFFVAIGQIIFTLVAGGPNTRLVCFGDSLAKYIFAILNFVTCRSEEKPFPFADWPKSECLDEEDEIPDLEDAVVAEENLAEQKSTDDVEQSTDNQEESPVTKEESDSKPKSSKKPIDAESSTLAEKNEAPTKAKPEDDAEPKV